MLKLAVSNIAWEPGNDEIVYDMMNQYGYRGLEIAPSRIFPESPYDHIDTAREWASSLKARHGLDIVSMQSVWYGRKENLFASKKERILLTDYTKKAIDFASEIGCPHLVFGNPRNRNINEETDKTAAEEFFYLIGEYAACRGIVIGIEAIPQFYHTNYINKTKDAEVLAEHVHSKGFRMNLDTGTMIMNRESIDEVKGKISLISHVHISEPGLLTIKKRMLHYELASVLKSEEYSEYVAIEMSSRAGIRQIAESMKYIKEVFG